MRELLGGDGNLYLINGGSYECIYVFQSHGIVHLTVHLKCVCFNTCILYFKKVDF